MPAARQLFVPDVFDDESAVCKIEHLFVEEGQTVERNERLVQLRSGSIVAEVTAPRAGTVRGIQHRPSYGVGQELLELAEPGAQEERPASRPAATLREVSSRATPYVAVISPTAAAVFVAAPAFRWPLAWIVISCVLALLWVAWPQVVRPTRDSPGADVARYPLRILGRAATVAASRVAQVTPVFVALGVVLASAVLGIVLAAVAGALVWIAREGFDGALAAARLAAYADAVTCFGFLVSAFVLRRALTSSERAERRAVLRPPRRDMPLHEAVDDEPTGEEDRAPNPDWRRRTLTFGSVLVTGAWVWAWFTTEPERVSVVATAERAVTRFTGNDVPPLADLRETIVAAEARRVVRCLHDPSRGTRWRQPTANMSGGVVRVSVVGGREDRPTPTDLAQLLIALDNQLSPFDATVTIEPRSSGVIEFNATPRHEPIAKPLDVLARGYHDDALSTMVAGAVAPSQARVAHALSCAATP